MLHLLLENIGTLHNITVFLVWLYHLSVKQLFITYHNHRFQSTMLIHDHCIPVGGEETTSFWHFGLVLSLFFNCHDALQKLDVLQGEKKKKNHLILMLERCQAHLRSKSICT